MGSDCSGNILKDYGINMSSPPKIDHAKFRRELEEAADSIERKALECECGNPLPCTGEFKFLVLYDIVSDDVAKLNTDRLLRCNKTPMKQFDKKHSKDISK